MCASAKLRRLLSIEQLPVVCIEDAMDEHHDRCNEEDMLNILVGLNDDNKAFLYVLLTHHRS